MSHKLVIWDSIDSLGIWELNKVIEDEAETAIKNLWK